MNKETFLFLAVTFCCGCKQRFDPPPSAVNPILLVVEGNLNASKDSTIIRLTKTQKLGDSASIKPELNATLTVEGKDNNIRPLSSRGNGYYVSPDLNLEINKEYRLRIRTATGKVYLSDFVKAKPTPPIDSIGWYRSNEGVRLYVNTKDLSGNTRYYRWEYNETWEIHSLYGPNVIYENGRIRDRVFPQEDVRVCWKNYVSTRIIMANTNRLQQDVVHQQPLLLIPFKDEKLLVRYSILVKQYAMDQEAYTFYELLRNNTENIGSIFSPQPSVITGNLHCLSNPDEPVIGYITAVSSSTKRIFISAVEASPWPYFYYCEETRVKNNRDSINYAIATGLIPSIYLGSPPDEYIFSRPPCVDCTTRGGSTQKPSFW
jgi:hypothetical protein